MPASSQRIQVGGHTPDGAAWAVLRLVKDGVVLAEAADAARLSAWWTLETGNHHFWIEGVQLEDSAIIRSEQSFVQVTPYAAPVVEELVQSP